MLFGGNAKTTLAEAEPQPPRHSDYDLLLDTVGIMLRVLGDHCFDLDDRDAQSTRSLFEAWAQHALIGAPPPESPSPALGQRDWSAMQRFVSTHRRKEAQFVTRSLRDLRQVIWDVVAGFNRSAASHGGEVETAQRQLERLRAALAHPDPAVLRREASVLIEVVEDVFSRQRERHRAELATFATRVRTLGEELEHARREGELDPMTRVHNRASFDGYLTRTVEFSTLFASPVALIVTDVDHFKSINDKYGHAVGDRVIRAFADRLSLTFPRRGDFVARFGGDEFAIVLKEVTPTDAKMLAQRLVDSVRRVEVPAGDSRISFSVSVGVTLHASAESASAWFARADAALYRAKAEGRDRFVAEMG